jgi:hypothetical protein
MSLATEIERVRERELAAKLNQGEAVLSAAIAEKIQPPAVELDDKTRALLKSFVDWCGARNVRYCPAKPATVAAYVFHQKDSAAILEILDAIEKLHDLHRLANPVQTAIVNVVLGHILKDEPPRSWTKEERREWWLLPPTVKAAISRRERDRERELRRAQNLAAELKKQLKTEGIPPSTTEKEQDHGATQNPQRQG